MEPENKTNFFDAARTEKKPVETDEDFYWYVIGVLPPIYAKGWTGLGEPFSYTSGGEVITYWVTEKDERYFCFFGTRREAENAVCDLS